MSGLSGFLRSVKAARSIELYLLILVMAVLALCFLNGSGKQSAAPTDLEARLEQALSCVEGAGDLRVMITEDAEGKTQGVLIVCEGADDLTTCLSLEQAVCKLLDVERSCVEIVRMISR